MALVAPVQWAGLDFGFHYVNLSFYSCISFWLLIHWFAFYYCVLCLSNLRICSNNWWTYKADVRVLDLNLGSFAPSAPGHCKLCKYLLPAVSGAGVVFINSFSFRSTLFFTRLSISISLFTPVKGVLYISHLIKWTSLFL